MAVKLTVTCGALGNQEIGANCFALMNLPTSLPHRPATRPRIRRRLPPHQPPLTPYCGYQLRGLLAMTKPRKFLNGEHV